MRIFKIIVHFFNLNKNSNKGILTSSDASFNSLNSRYVSKPAGAVPFNSHSKTFIRQRQKLHNIQTFLQFFQNVLQLVVDLLQTKTANIGNYYKMLREIFTKFTTQKKFDGKVQST